MSYRRYYDRKVALFAAHAAPGRVLDYGCGTGSYSRSLASHGWEVWGVDSNAERLKEAEQLAARDGLGSSCNYVEVPTTARQLPFDHGYFDAMFASEVIEHLPDLATWITEVKRVLRPGGSLYLTTPNGVSYRHVAKNLIWKAPKRIPVIESWPQYLPGKEGHLYYWDLWTLYRLMHINGFTYKAHGYVEPHRLFERLTAAVPPLQPLRTGLLLMLEHTNPELTYC